MRADTRHYVETRYDREKAIQEIGGEGHVVASFYVDRGHKNGPEIHQVTDNGIVKVYNAWSKKLVTTLIARPGQITRYYSMAHKKAPEEIIAKARLHQERGLNYC